MDYRKLPKVELHCHLDGSLRTETVIELAKEENIDLSGKTYEEVKELLVVPEDCPSLDIYLKRFDLPLKLMQNEKNLKRIAFELIEDVSKENVKYIEVRFAPLLHNRQGLNIKQIINAVLEGLKDGEEKFGVKSGLILSLLRHHPVDSVYEVFEEGKEFLGKGVVAVDLAGAELEGFVPQYEEAFKKARDMGYRVTIHAGETGYSCNVIDAIKLLGAERIGHAVAIKDDEVAYNLVKENNITLEMCPKSNLQTKAVDSYKNHPAKKFLNDGLKVNLSTDNRTVSNLDLTEECESINKVSGLSLEEFKQIYLNSVEGAFCNDETKAWLRKQI
ncbi:adenosine deaminase [Clostridium massiliamazoniense]|uniref:adenosine deaminase n=1 Tax=Clostridium massiliamazoniense TaxID=1347366 RepID=UPI0006D763CD|nr:adenosine deaminase [Clostridium massiliamazoniense]